MSGAVRPFDRTTLEDAFDRLARMARAEGKIVEISVYGGSALILSTPWRISTEDVDAVFDADKTFVRRAAATIAEEFGWNEDWINDGVKGFLSANDAQGNHCFAPIRRKPRPGCVSSWLRRNISLP